jgi:hypothetical protein
MAPIAQESTQVCCVSAQTGQSGTPLTQRKPSPELRRY